MSLTTTRRISTSTSATIPTTDMSLEITSLAVTRDGSGIRVTLRRDGEVEKHRISLGALSELGLKKGAADDVVYDDIISEERKYLADRKSENILAYGANSAKNLELKLRAGGFSADEARSAAQRRLDEGKINESRDALRIAELSLKKGWGKHRIIDHLYSKGYRDASLVDAKRMLDEYDFLPGLISLIERKYGHLPDDRRELDRLIAALLRLGYDMHDIRSALREIK